MAKNTKGPALVRLWQLEMNTNGADPYTTVMMGNIEDGVSVREIGKPKDRKEFTSPWPFRVH
jgi:hypothetical protein